MKCSVVRASWYLPRRASPTTNGDEERNISSTCSTVVILHSSFKECIKLLGFLGALHSIYCGCCTYRGNDIILRLSPLPGIAVVVVWHALYVAPSKK